MSKFYVGQEVEYVRHSKEFPCLDAANFVLGKKYKIKYFDEEIYLDDIGTFVFHYQIRPVTKKEKKKPYWVEVGDGNEMGFGVWLIARNGISSHYPLFEYCTLREARQMAKRLARNLGLDFKQ